MNFYYGLVIGIILGYLLVYLQTDDYYIRFQLAVKGLTRQAARWATAAEQDENPIIAVLHANYGAGYLWALSDIATPDEIEDITKIDYRKFVGEIVRIQDQENVALIKKCPEFSPPKSYLAAIGGEGLLSNN